MKKICLKVKPKILDYNDVKKILQFANKFRFNIWIVGGAIRDHLMGREVKDIDFVCDIKPKRLFLLLEQHNFHVENKFLNYGTVIVKLDQASYYITSLRKDLDYDGRHAKVSFTKSLKVDSFRRDLTINGLYLNKKKEIIDYYNGLEDLKNCKLKFIGDIEIKCKEDNLRLLRYLRFCSIFDNPLLPLDHFNFIEKNFEILKKIPKRKIICEFKKIYKNKYYENSFLLIKYLNLDIFFKKNIGINFPNYDTKFKKKFLHNDKDYFTFKSY